MRKYTQEDVNYIKQWVKEISKKLSKDMTFEEWIDGYNCEERYPPQLLISMKMAWDEGSL